MASMKDGQLFISGLSEWLIDKLNIIAFVNGRSVAHQVGILLDAQIPDVESDTESKLQYLAEKRGISVAELKRQILTGEAKRLPPEATVGNDTV